MPYVRVKSGGPWHFVPKGKMRTLCNIAVNTNGAQWGKELFKGEVPCKNCEILVSRIAKIGGLTKRNPKKPKKPKGPANPLEIRKRVFSDREDTERIVRMVEEGKTMKEIVEHLQANPL